MKRNQLFTVGMLAVLTIAGVVQAGVQAKVGGIVTDSAGNPLGGVVITVTSPDVSTFEKVIKTSKNGKYKTIILDATRRYTMVFEADGYQPHTENFKVGVGTTDNVYDITLMSLKEAAAKGKVDLLQQPGYKEFEEGKALYRAGDMAGARAKFQEAVAAKPDLTPALVGLADLTYEAGDSEAALAIAKQCLEQDSESVACLAVAANASADLGDEAGRVEYMARYQEVNPDDPTVLYNDAAAKLNAMDDEGARPLLEKCLEADPDFPQCNFEYGMMLLRTGDLEGAKTHLQKYLEVAPGGPDAGTAEETLKYL